MRAQAGFDVAQTLAISELGKSQGQELIEAGKTLYLVIAMVTIHATAKLDQRKQVHQLSKNRSATVHALILARFFGFVQISIIFPLSVQQ